MHPNFEKYRAVSNQLHEIWNTYATASEYIALDFAGNLDKIFHGETLYRTIEYMRKHR